MGSVTRDGAHDFVRSGLGYPIYFNEEDSRGLSLKVSGGNLNPESLRLWRAAVGLRIWDAAVDVGSNYGEMIVGIDYPPTTEVIAFEPNVMVLPYLERTLAEYPHPVELLRLAVSDTVLEEVQFSRDVTWSGKSTLVMGEREDTVGDSLVVDSVTVTTLDHVLGDRHLSSACIKIDVEGAEEAALRGAQSLLSKLPEWAVMLEILHMTMRQIAELVRTHYFYLLDLRSGSLVRVGSSNPVVLERIFESDWLYRQDALLLSSPGLVE